MIGNSLKEKEPFWPFANLQFRQMTTVILF